MAAVTFANGGDNLGIYTLVSQQRLPRVLVFLGVFFALLAFWCGLGCWFTRQLLVSGVLKCYGHWVVPFVLIGLGISILIQSETYRLFCQG